MEQRDDPTPLESLELAELPMVPDQLAEPEPDVVDNPPIAQQQFSRRQFFHFAIQAAAAAHAVDAIGAESLRWNRDEPSFTHLESDQTMEKI